MKIFFSVRYYCRLSLFDPEKFSVSIGKRVLDKKLVPNGAISVYSANVMEPFGFIDKLPITDSSVPSVLWGIDGDWMTSYIPEEKEFYPTDHCGVLRCKTPDVNPRYLVHIFEVEGKKMDFSRSFLPVKSCVVELLRHPFRHDGVFLLVL